ncbi:MAG: NAD(P)-dependent oxidoreductase [Candidatus Moraniibacteriota bacterium]
MEKKKVLILGAEGMLGQELVRAFSSDEQYTVTGWDFEDIDVTDFVAAEEKIRAYKPQILLNAVAYNAVDACEENDEEYEKALLLNTEVPKFLACVAKALGAVLVHYSTDYVFDGVLEAENKESGGCASGSCCGGNCHGGAEQGYDEESLPNPLSRYGMSKYQGEQGVRREAEKYYLIRLSKLFGKAATSAAAKKSFFEKMLEAAEGQKEVSVVDDEQSCFTYAPDLAQATKTLLEESAPYGIYHLANSGGVTWYVAARELFRLAKKDIVVKPVSGDTFPRLAQRPHCSILVNTKRSALRPYTEALEEFLQKEKTIR